MTSTNSVSRVDHSAWATDVDWQLPVLKQDNRLSEYDRLFIVNPKVDQFATRVLDLMARTDATLERNAKTRSHWGKAGAKLDELTLLPLFGPSGAGKSKTIQYVTDKIHHARKHSDKLPVLVVTLRASKDAISNLQASILEAFRDPSARFVRKRVDYSESQVNAGISAIARKLSTRVVILDEAHNALMSSTPEEVAAALKSILNDGVFSIVLSGTEAMAPIFGQAELRQRSEAPLDFSPPRVSDYRGCLEFFQATERLCKRIYEAGIVALPFSPLVREDQCALLFEMSSGNFGRVVSTIRRGLKLAFERGMSSLDWDDVVEAHNNWVALEGLASGESNIVSQPNSRTVGMVREVVRRHQNAR